MRESHSGTHNGASLKLLTAFVVFVAGRELFQLYTKCSGWIASLVGVALWCLFTYLMPPRPKLWKLLLVAASIALAVTVLHLLHVG
jgi:hypothetical protein